MSKKSLQDWLINNNGFQIQYRNLIIDSVLNQFSGLVRYDEYSQLKHDWSYLLFCASFLAQSEKGICQDIALRIAQYCLVFNDTSKAEIDAAAVILDTLSNRPAIKLAENRNLLDKNYVGRLPPTLLQDWTKRSIENAIVLSNHSSIQVNKFQKRFWKEAINNDWVSISAPTTAGKSFIISRWLIEYLRNNLRSKIVYIVPTRALIQQVQFDIENHIKTENIEGVSVTSLPIKTSIIEEDSNVFVFTQERFHILLGERESNISIDLLIIDEAQKIGDSHRGVLLQQAIETAINKNIYCKVMFASPMTENPNILVDDVPDSVLSASLISEDIMVNQNLIWVSQVKGQPRHWNVELVLNTNPIIIGQVFLPASPTPISKRLPFVAFTLGNSDGGNVIYVNGAADAETTAKQLYGLLEDDPVLLQDKEINELIELIKKTIHSKYYLKNVIHRGIAFHYGNMPILIRTEIERLFSINKIKYLICTSTLIEGINMPCQTIFVRGPTKGRGNPMTNSDFWNLAGRAGRWGKEFQGNVVCVDARRKDVWKEGAPKGRTKYRISRTTDEVLDQSDELLSFIKNNSSREEAAKNPKLEYVFSYLVSALIQNGSISQSIWARRFPVELIKKLDESIAEKVKTFNTPQEVILRNPGISPIAMDNLLEYFNNRTVNRGENIEGLIPVPAESEDAVTEYAKILHRINAHLGKDIFGRAKRVRQLALLIVNWMNGYPLARIISSREKFCRDRGDVVKLPGLIRNTMKDVEEIARFKAPKYLACYVDVLRFFLTKFDRHDLVERLQDLNILLEFGVSQITQLSLLGLGISRSSAIALSEFIKDTNLNESECLVWLSENDWMTEDMPELIKREISQVLEIKILKNKINE